MYEHLSSFIREIILYVLRSLHLDKKSGEEKYGIKCNHIHNFISDFLMQTCWSEIWHLWANYQNDWSHKNIKTRLRQERDFSTYFRISWICAIHKCATIQRAQSTGPTYNMHKAQDQHVTREHVDVRRTWMREDRQDSLVEKSLSVFWKEIGTHVQWIGCESWRLFRCRKNN